MKWVGGILTAAVVLPLVTLGVQHLTSSGPGILGGARVALESVNIDGESGNGITATASTLTPDQVDRLIAGSSLDDFNLSSVYFVGSMRVQVALKGRGPGTTRIVDIRPRIIHRFAPVSGSRFDEHEEGGISVLPLHADLDSPDPDFLLESGAKFRQGQNWDLAPGERLTLDISLTAEQHAYDWDLELKFSDGKIEHVGDENGDPFKVSGAANHYAQEFVFGTEAPNVGWHLES